MTSRCLNTLVDLRTATATRSSSARIRGGPTCYTSEATYRDSDSAPTLARTLSKLSALLAQPRRDLPPGSYFTELFRKRRGAIAQKVGEEALELALAATTETRERAVSETRERTRRPGD
jgi:phosphoribosyl-ATP pyrophosphohydrolase/phosphoribosyl-AMP cyclohydrolase